MYTMNDGTFQRKHAFKQKPHANATTPFFCAIFWAQRKTLAQTPRIEKGLPRKVYP